MDCQFVAYDKTLVYENCVLWIDFTDIHIFVYQISTMCHEWWIIFSCIFYGYPKLKLFVGASFFVIYDDIHCRHLTSKPALLANFSKRKPLALNIIVGMQPLNQKYFHHDIQRPPPLNILDQIGIFYVSGFCLRRKKEYACTYILQSAPFTIQTVMESTSARLNLEFLGFKFGCQLFV